MLSFSEKVYAVVAKIPPGKVTTYGAIAFAIGSPRSARQVGCAMSRCPADLPWHRVLKKDGTFGPKEGSRAIYAQLRKEGVPFLTEDRVDLRLCFWQGENL